MTEIEWLLRVDILTPDGVDNWVQKKRSLKERLFTLPWQPFVMIEDTDEPNIYYIGDLLIASSYIAAKIKTDRDFRLKIIEKMQITPKY